VKSVADHSTYDDAYQKAADWLSDTEAQLNTVSDSKWDSHETLIQHLAVIKVLMCSFA